MHYYKCLQDMGDIVGEVCEWSTADIENDYLLTSYLTELPTRFDNPYEYFLAFGALTLEEVRAQLKKGLQTLVNPSFPVQIGSPSRLGVSIGFPAKAEPYIARSTRTNDVLLLTRDPNPIFSTSADTKSIIAVVQRTEAFDPEKNTIHWCEVQVHKSHQLAFTLALQSPTDRPLWSAVFLASIPVLKRLRRFVATLSEKKCLPRFMNMILDREVQGAGVKSNEDLLPTTRAPVQKTVFEAIFEEENLNESQKRCMIEVLGKNGVHLIHGPPGTGKTTTLVALLRYLFETNTRTIQAAPTNIAVGEVAKKFIARAQSGSCFHSQFILNDLVLIGDSERIELDGLLDSIFLDRRVHRLQEVLEDWPASLKEFDSFLYTFPEQFSDERRKSEESISNASTELPWVFFHKLSYHHTTNIQKHISVLLGDLPSPILSKYTPAKLAEHLDLIKEFLENLQTYQSEYQKAKDFAFHYSWGTICRPLRSVIDRLHTSAKSVISSTCNISPFGTATLEVKRALERSILDYARIIFATVGCTGRQIMTSVLERVHTLPEAETAILFRRFLHRLVLAGDHKQLPATVISSAAKKFLYDRSLFERLDPAQYHSSFLLDTQYRMHPEISKFPKHMFYEGQLNDWEGLVNKEPMPWHIATTTRGQKIFPPFAIFDLDSIETKDPCDTSIYNETEASFIANYLLTFAKVLESRKTKEVVGVGVVTPYTAQVKAVKQQLSNVVGAEDEGVFRISGGVEVEVKSVDGSQGQERDVIIISLVRSNDGGNIGFVDDERRLNVALTRAKHSCFVVGNSKTLARHNRIFVRLISDSKQRGVYFNTRLYPDLAELANAQRLVLSRATDLLERNSALSRNLQTSLMLNTVWKVSLTRNALIAIKDMTSREARDKILGFLNRLAEGYRPNKIICSTQEYKALIQSRVVAGSFVVVWGIALETHEGYYNQIIQVYEIVPGTQATQAIQRVEFSLSRHTADYLDKISRTEKEDAPESGKRRRIPMAFSRVPRILWYRDLKNNVDDKIAGELRIEEVEDPLTLAKKYKLTAEVVRLIIENTIDNVELPLTLTEDETDIVNQRDSLFILGRSGTGKTTVMMMRMFQCEKLYYAQMDSYERKPIQVMLTASPSLCGAMNEYYRKLRKLIVRPDEQDQDLQTGENQSLEGARLDDLPNPAFISFSDFLVIMDHHLERPFLPQNRRLLNRTAVVHEAEAVHDLAEQFEVGHVFMPRSRARWRTKLDGREVTFDRFRDIYWQHLSFNLRRKYDVSVIWTEFQSSIKGSLSSLSYPNGKLPCTAFLALADSRNSTFNFMEREEIYALFQNYENLKRDKKDWDVGDLTSHIFLELAQTGYNGRVIDFVYVDEVQDLTPAQIALFKYVCRSQYGFVFAGDTAQTISAGVGFRFQSIQDLFYKDILPYIDPTLTNLARFVPNMHILSQNYRTHSGILRLANWIVEILYQCFPLTIDKLPREESLVCGPLPIFLEDTDIAELLVHLFGKGDTVSHEFGAEQAIIVRDEKTKGIVSQLIETALVLTVYEAKGLEFEDVLCYNFFTDSSFEKWRILYSLDQNGILAVEKFQTLCSELKALYVVITRCKKRLWFFDCKREKRNPALDIWKTQNLVKDLLSVDQNGCESEIAPMARKSTHQKWQQLGTTLFEKRMYKDAGKCFTRAHDYRNARLCEALIAETEGEIYADNRRMTESQQKYSSAAQIFEELCEHRRAASAYVAAWKFDGAQRMFRILLEYDDALYCCLKGKLPKEAFDILGLADVDSRLKEKWGRRFALWRHSEKDTKGMLRFLGHIGSENGRRAFLERYKYYDELLQFNTQAEDFERMAAVYEKKGDLFAAARCWKKHGSTEGLIRVLLRMARPLYCFALAEISFDTIADLRRIHDLLRDVAGCDSTASFELKFLMNLSNISLAEERTWTLLLNEIQARNGIDCGGLDLMAKFLVLESQWQSKRWQSNPQTFITALKSCHREFTELGNKLTETAMSQQKHECYRVFGLEDTRNPENCLVNDNVLLIIQPTTGSGKLMSGMNFSRTEMKMSEFATIAQRFLGSKTEEMMRRGLQVLKQIAESMKPCPKLLLGSGTACVDVECARAHDEMKYLQEERERIQIQIQMVELAADCKNLSPDFAIEHKYHRAELLDMLNPVMPNFFNPWTIIEFKKHPSVNMIFEEYKREVKERELNELRLAMALLISESTSSLIWYPQLAQMKKTDNQYSNLWMLWQAFNWLRVHDISEDPILKSAIMGTEALLTIARWGSRPPQTSISLSPQFYIPLLERFTAMLILRNGRLWASCLPTRLLVETICGDKCPNFDYIPFQGNRYGWQHIGRLKDMLCWFFQNNLEPLKSWFYSNKLSEVKQCGYMLRILSLVFVLYLNFRHFREEIGHTLLEVNWETIGPLGLLRNRLQRFKSAKNIFEHTNQIVELVGAWREEFLVITVAEVRVRVPQFLQRLRQVKISANDPIKLSLERHLLGLSASPAVRQIHKNVGTPQEAKIQKDFDHAVDDDQDEMTEENTVMEAAPVEEEIEVKLPRRIDIRIRQVLASVRAMIERRNAIENPRERYEFVATEYFKRRAVSSDFLSFYLKVICGLRANLAANLEKVEVFLRSPPKMDGVEEIVDEMLTYKEASESYLASLDVNNPHFMRVAAYGYTQQMATKGQRHLDNGEKEFGEYLKKLTNA